MKKIILLLLIFLMGVLTLPNSKLIAGDGGNFGAGIIIGEPTGLSFKYWLDSKNSNAIDGALAWSIDNDKFFQIHANYLFHNYRIFKVKRGKLGFYFGGGIRIKLRNNDNNFDDNNDKNDSKVGIRIPLGLNYMFSGVPIDVFLEIVPVMDIIPSTEFGFNGSIGARYFF